MKARRPSLLDLDALADKLKMVNFNYFIDDHLDDLCQYTIVTLQLYVTLGFTKNQIEFVKDTPLEYDKSHRIYQLVKQGGDIEVFLKALQATNNGRIIQLITEWLKNSEEGDPVAELDTNPSSVVDTTQSKEWILGQLESGKSIESLLQPFFDEICKNTDVTRLVASLYASETISRVQKEEILVKDTTDYEKCNLLYNMISKKGAGKELVEALDKIENKHILLLLCKENN